MMYLTDEGYKKILLKIREVVSKDDFKPNFYDSTEPGNKYTTSNCGFCNDDFTDADTARWPDDFPSRREMLYRKDHHKCPFDMRKKPDCLGFGDGCFHTCLLFSNSKKRKKFGFTFNQETIKKMVANTIRKYNDYKKPA